MLQIETMGRAETFEELASIKNREIRLRRGLAFLSRFFMLR